MSPWINEVTADLNEAVEKAGWENPDPHSEWPTPLSAWEVQTAMMTAGESGPPQIIKWFCGVEGMSMDPNHCSVHTPNEVCGYRPVKEAKAEGLL